MAGPMEHDEAARAGPDAPAGRAIILFSDGTGNSSAKLFKTNVWRMYEAVDLGPAAAGKRKQIAFYDNGVGTSALRPLALLGGIFGFGLRRNILDLYRFACRNYRPAPGQRRGGEPPAGGDAIYGFGFSRGAFTMRLVIALIASQGLVAGRDEADLHRLTRDAYRAFRADFLPRKLQWPTRLYRRLRAGVSRRWRGWRGHAIYDPAMNYRAEIPFMGVWDTVAAYGGPIVEITRGVDNWLYALSMSDYRLDPRVACARHALAIDDARDAFHPLLWDEVNEDALVAAGTVSADRLRQVWFTGMHTDVGGGYPDESLSFVSFLWMMEEANRAGLRTLDIVTDRFRAIANSAGPLHDSRAGPGAYYRYQPRDIEAWLDGAGTGSIIADPAIRDAGGRQRGLLTRVRVHESVIARIADGTDGYAPVNLPAAIALVPEGPGETVAQPDSESPHPPPPPAEQVTPPMVPPALRKRVEDSAIGEARVAALQPAWDRVWLRRVAYFLTLLATLLLVLMPWWVEHWFNPPVMADGRSWLGGLIRLLTPVTPAIVHGLIDTAADNAFWFGVLVAVIVGLQMWSGRLERQMREGARAVWRATLAPGDPPSAPEPSLVERLRSSGLYRGLFRSLKWHILPVVATLALVAFLAWMVTGLVAQSRLPGLERGDALCPRLSATRPLQATTVPLSTAAACVTTGQRVSSKARYAVELEITGRWRDGGLAATPRGLSAGDLGWAGYVGLPWRRVIGANYLQPVIAIRRGPGPLQIGGGDRVHMEPLALRQSVDRPEVWRGSFTAPRGGELMLFVNEAVPPFGLPLDHFYTGRAHGNAGTARVTIRLVDPAP